MQIMLKRSFKERLIIASLALVSTLMVAQVANAQPDEGESSAAMPQVPRPPMPALMIRRLDKDGDQRISIDEFKSPMHGMQRLKEADADADGNLTRAEMQAHVAREADRDAERANQRFDEADLNSDGVITPEERKQAAFSRMDGNADGYLSADEFAAMARHGGRREMPPRSEDMSRDDD